MKNRADSNPKPRAALFISSMSGGGAERVIKDLASGFVQQGIQVDIVLMHATGPYLDEIPPEINIVDLNAQSVKQGLSKLMKYIQTAKPDAILSALRWPNVIAQLARALGRHKPRLVISEHASIKIMREQKQTLKRRILRFLMRMTYPHADIAVGVSEEITDDLIHILKVPSNKAKTVYNPVQLSTIDALGALPLSDIPHNLVLGSSSIVLAAGRLTEQKDFGVLIEAFRIVTSESDAKLVILGEGPERKKLEALITKHSLERRILLPGFSSNPYAWMKNADLFALSSRWEGLPLVLIEAMACSLPIVATDCPSGPAEILEDGKWGTLVGVGDIDALANSILESLKRPRQEHPNTRERAEQFDASNAVGAYLDLLNTNKLYN